MAFQFKKMEIPEVVLIEPQVFGDNRGFFLETYKSSDFLGNGISDQIVQSMYSRSAKGTLRGLHYQKHPKAQGKLVQAIHGEIFDVAVDLRKGSPTYLHWVGAVLSAEHHQMLFVPVGFAHGFLVLSEEADVGYQVFGGEYAPDLERGIIWNDPTIGVQWPRLNPVLSDRDSKLPTIERVENNFSYQGAVE